MYNQNIFVYQIHNEQHKESDSTGIRHVRARRTCVILNAKNRHIEIISTLKRSIKLHQ